MKLQQINSFNIGTFRFFNPYTKQYLKTNDGIIQFSLTNGTKANNYVSINFGFSLSILRRDPTELSLVFSFLLFSFYFRIGNDENYFEINKYIPLIGKDDEKI
ncbi:hypothetical protein SNEBB_003917 [Seison nebaliae]|nr:hypothetical protein SNEBB_003917 [Seison nebaliae]